MDDVFASDDSRLSFLPGITLNPDEPPVWLVFDATLPDDNPPSLQLVLESQANTPGLTGTLEAFNWQTNEYEIIDASSTSSGTDSVISIDLSGNISNYVESGTGAVRCRIGWRQTGLTLLYPWQIGLDQLVWLAQ